MQCSSQLVKKVIILNFMPNKHQNLISQNTFWNLDMYAKQTKEKYYLN